jgi:plastocyanin
MSQVTDDVIQEHPKTPLARARPPLSALSKVTLVALLGIAMVVTANFLVIWLLYGAFVPEFFVGIVPALTVAGLIAGRLRWVPALGAGVALLIIVFFLIAPEDLYTLTHPGNDFISFMLELLALAFALVVIVAGVGATIQNYQGGQPRSQRWLQPILTGFTGIVVGMLILGTLVAANPTTSSASSITNGVPTVHMTVDNFSQNVVLLSKGDKLLIVDDASVEHILLNGVWTNGTARTIAESGAPVVHNVDITGGSVQIGPFNTAGIFHIYCAIHQGMNLTIVVQ